MTKFLSFCLGFIGCGVLCVATLGNSHVNAKQTHRDGGRLEGVLILPKNDLPPNEMVSLLRDIKQELVKLNKEVEVQGKEQRNIVELIRGIHP